MANTDVTKQSWVVMCADTESEDESYPAGFAWDIVDEHGSVIAAIYDNDSMYATRTRALTMASAHDLLRVLEQLVLFERADPALLERLAEDSASRDEVPTAEKWRERLVQEAEKVITKIREVHG